MSEIQNIGGMNTIVFIPLRSTESNSKLANKSMNIMRAVLKNIIDLSMIASGHQTQLLKVSPM